ncbi:sodium/proline symporter PutP [Kocuria sp. JC486]|uniref:sodium/proline symporter PutP n=1 Tax=Kocuria sp. JC486 TaxID=1970736 RepID=UPI00141ECBEA|nr:sodium/proline symporter PutP [Kocuria sp. JC486]NHU84674.1 sodium/proline symporter PutP [Kocuria sp. JC486]
MVDFGSGFWWMLAAIGLYFAAMLGVGVWASLKTQDKDDYMIGGRNLPPAVAALSAGASDMSGWLLMGLPGALYMGGMVQAWIAIGLTVGAWVNWKIVAPRLRVFTEKYGNSITLPSFLGNRLVRGGRALRIVSGLVILVFFTFYISSGMVAGGNFATSAFGAALEQTAGWDSDTTYLVGMCVIAGVTIFYTLIGGFLGATYTDFFQGALMFLALLTVPVVVLFMVGDPGRIVERVDQVHPGAWNLFDFDAAGGLIVVISLIAWGLGYFGQPHILVRFMALSSHDDAVAGRRVGVGWMLLCVLGAMFTALFAIPLVDSGRLALTNEETAETVFLDSAIGLFPAFLAGLVLAAVLAAIMSTVASQLVVTASALVEDLALLFRKETLSPKASLWLSRAGVFVVALVAMAMAFNPSESILNLVGFAWAGFGAAFGPITLLALYWRKLTGVGAIAAMITGAAVVFIWPNTPWSDLYELAPGFIAATVAAVVVSLITYRADPGVDQHFDDAVAMSHRGLPADSEPASESTTESAIGPASGSAASGAASSASSTARSGDSAATNSGAASTDLPWAKPQA